MKVTPVLKLIIELEDDEPTDFVRYLRACLSVRDLHVDDAARDVAARFCNALDNSAWDRQGPVKY